MTPAVRTYEPPRRRGLDIAVLVWTLGVVVGGVGGGVCCGVSVAAQGPEKIVAILVHGNHTTPDTDILAIAGLTVGDAAGDERLREAERKLWDSGRFDAVDVRKRSQSLSDASAILVVLLVDERPGVSDTEPIPGPLSRLRGAGMWLPILSKRDGYGLTYGARVSFADPLGPRSRLSTPLTWGGERHAAMELERSFDRSGLTTGRVTLSIDRQVNPHFDVADTRQEIAVRADRTLIPWLRAGATARASRVSFAARHERHRAAGLILTLDTRTTPTFPRNAVHATVAFERLAFRAALGAGDVASGPASDPASGAGRWTTDLRGYLGIGGAAVLAVRGQAVRASAPLPLSEQSLLGGADSLRGYRAGHRAGDSVAVISVEARVPLTSPLRLTRFGVRGFVDAGTTWLANERLADQRFDRGVGAGVYFGAAVVTGSVDIAWPERGRPRLHVGFGVGL